MRSWDDRWQPGNYEKNLTTISELTALADAKGIAPAAVTVVDDM